MGDISVHLKDKSEILEPVDFVDFSDEEYGIKVYIRERAYPFLKMPRKNKPSDVDEIVIPANKIETVKKWNET